MKKFLSFILVLAMIFGCVSMSTFVQAEGVKYAGVKVDNFANTAEQNQLVFYNVTDGVTIEGENATITLVVYYTNPSQQTVWFDLILYVIDDDVDLDGEFNLGNEEIFTPFAVTSTTSVGSASSEDKVKLNVTGITSIDGVSSGEKVELNATFPANYVTDKLIIDIVVGVEGGTALSTDAEFIFSSNANIIPDSNKYMSGFGAYPCTADATPIIAGDIDGVAGVSDRDAVYLLYHTFLPDSYPVNQNCDFNKDNEVNDKDAIYLLYHTFLPESYPIR